MKNRLYGSDPEMEQLVEGLTPNQIKLLTSIFAGKAKELRKKNTAESLAKWKDRKFYRWN